MTKHLSCLHCKESLVEVEGRDWPWRHGSQDGPVYCSPHASSMAMPTKIPIERDEPLFEVPSLEQRWPSVPLVTHDEGAHAMRRGDDAHRRALLDHPAKGRDGTHWCPNPECGRYIYRQGDVYRCWHCLGRQQVDPDTVGEWPASVIEHRTTENVG